MSWQQKAACRTEDPELFFPVGQSGPAQLQARRAKEICARCPVRESCLSDALDAGDTSGVWGGTTEEERRAIRRRTGRRRTSASGPSGHGGR
ncbi:WhiB family transcriptional regulator, redox-sensing transcriptional regulator [Streptomyces sp. DvalAA-14]|uniref:WhiB family transcriptional regulator n=1 Tax=Streptomyces sp. DvalAA-14 TaxID=1839759 RepID=UPI00081B0288|nr:WhiB family transcriptional regulator [Streptomyces sp. DvalAA-14]SCE34708.1 WhiB family transcriptional regulator, redox-sensing transcriptional regulator [Streptomyces sp. DvalAA-14]